MKSYVIKPRTGWEKLNFKELYEYRDLFSILLKRDVKLRYRQTALGVLWVVFQPLLIAIISAIIFGRLAHLSSEGIPYVVFIFAGMLPWYLFSQGLQKSSGSLVGNSMLVTKVFFPRNMIPIASTVAVLVDFLICFFVMLGLLLIYHIPLQWNIVFLPIFLGVALMFSIGMGLLFSALNVYYRDFSHILPFFLQVYLYVSPIFYSKSLIKSEWLSWYCLNPLVGIVDSFRWCLLGETGFPWYSFSIATVLSCLIFFGSSLFFQRVEKYFADVI